MDIVWKGFILLFLSLFWFHVVERVCIALNTSPRMTRWIGAALLLILGIIAGNL